MSHWCPIKWFEDWGAMAIRKLKRTFILNFVKISSAVFDYLLLFSKIIWVEVPENCDYDIKLNGFIN